MTRAHLRPLAEADLVERTRFYNEAGGPDLGRRFFDAAIDALRSAEAMPGTRSPTIGELIAIPRLRRLGLEGFPCGWLYREHTDHLDVIRSLADRQDLETTLGSTP